MIRVLAHLDEPVLALGLETALRAAPEIEFRCAATLSEVWSSVDLEPPDVILLNLTPSISIDAIRTIASTANKSNVVLWVRTIDPDLAAEAIRSGVHGILRRTLQPELLVSCLRKVADGELWIEKSYMKYFLEGKALRLTARENDVVNALAHGLRNKEIAELLDLTEASVKVYVSRLLKKLGFKDRFELGLYGLKQAGSFPLEQTPVMDVESRRAEGPKMRRPVRPEGWPARTLRRAHSA